MFGPVAAEVGLQLLLRPYSSALGEVAWYAMTAYTYIYIYVCVCVCVCVCVFTSVCQRLSLRVLGICCSNIAGVIYPCYASFKAAELLRLHGDSSEAHRWLTYWGVYGCFASLGRIVDGLKTWYVGCRRSKQQFYPM